jgi:hypothetical protein
LAASSVPSPAKLSISIFSLGTDAFDCMCGIWVRVCQSVSQSLKSRST